MGDFDINIDKVSANSGAGQVRNVAPAKDKSAAVQAKAAEAKAAEVKRAEADDQPVNQVKQLVQQGDTEEETLQRVAEYLQSFIPDLGANTSLKIDKDEDAGRFVYRSVDNKTGETVRQFPPEDLLGFLKKFREASGILVDDKV